MYSANTGILCCGESNAKSDFTPSGLGMVVYLKILKAFTIIFFVISFFNIPLYYIYSSNHPQYIVTSYKDLLFKTTIGNIGSSNLIYFKIN